MYASWRGIKRTFLRAQAVEYPRAAVALESWIDDVRVANWKSPVDMKKTLKDVDPVKVKSGHTVYVCNVRRNEFRLIIAVHFGRQRVFALRFMTHAEYSQAKWKQEL